MSQVDEKNSRQKRRANVSLVIITAGKKKRKLPDAFLSPAPVMTLMVNRFLPLFLPTPRPSSQNTPSVIRIDHSISRAKLFPPETHIRALPGHPPLLHLPPLDFREAGGMNSTRLGSGRPYLTLNFRLV